MSYHNSMKLYPVARGYLNFESAWSIKEVYSELLDTQATIRELLMITKYLEFLLVS